MKNNKRKDNMKNNKRLTKTKKYDTNNVEIKKGEV